MCTSIRRPGGRRGILEYLTRPHFSVPIQDHGPSPTHSASSSAPTSLLALTDGVGLEADEAKQTMLDAARWLLTGAIAP